MKMNFNEVLECIGVEAIMKCLLYREIAECEYLEKEKNFETYLIRDKSTGLCKIGKTTDIKKRIEMLSCSNTELELLFIIDKDVEKELHDVYESKRYKGEWFNLSDLDLEIISNQYQKRNIPACIR
jgi:hypothetical protein